MWFLYVFVATSILLFIARVWGRHLYNRWGRLVLRKIVGKRRAVTPPLEAQPLNSHSVYDVYDDAISADGIEKTHMVNFLLSSFSLLKTQFQVK